MKTHQGSFDPNIWESGVQPPTGMWESHPNFLLLGEELLLVCRGAAWKVGFHLTSFSPSFFQQLFPHSCMNIAFSWWDWRNNSIQVGIREGPSDPVRFEKWISGNNWWILIPTWKSSPNIPGDLLIFQAQLWRQKAEQEQLLGGGRRNGDRRKRNQLFPQNI